MRHDDVAYHIKRRKNSRKMFYSSGFHEWRASQQSIYSFLLGFCWLRYFFVGSPRERTQQWSRIHRNHYVIIAIMISLANQKKIMMWRREVWGKRHLAFATTIKVIKMKINKFIALVLRWCLMNQSRFLLTYSSSILSIILWCFVFLKLFIWSDMLSWCSASFYYCKCNFVDVFFGKRNFNKKKQP